jgi:hypothetical protein
VKIANENEDVLIIRGPVIPVGIQDSQGNIVDPKTIKTFFANFETQETDVMHSLLTNEGVTIIGNSILDSPKVIAGNKLKPGSWYSEMRSTNQELNEHLLNGDLRGFSLSTLPGYAKPVDYWITHRGVHESTENNYENIGDLQQAEPRWISFVDRPSHGLDFEVLTLDDYINKRIEDKKNLNGNVRNMTNKTEDKNTSTNESFGLIERLVNMLVNKAEETPAGVPVETKTEEKTEEVNPDLVTKDDLAKTNENFVTKDDLKTFGEELVKELKVNNKSEDNPDDGKSDDGDKDSGKDDGKTEGKDDGKTESETEYPKPQSKKPENTETPMVNKSFQERKAERRGTKDVLMFY